MIRPDQEAPAIVAVLCLTGMLGIAVGAVAVALLRWWA